MKKIGKILFTIIFTFLSLFSYPLSIYAATGEITISGTENFDYIKEVHKIVNEERAKKGKSALILDKELTNRAMKRASEIAVYYSHTRANDSDTFTIFDGLSYSTAGENIAVGYTTPSAVMTGWMNSPGHCANIMGYEYDGKDYSKYFTTIGIGHIEVNGTNYWVQLFSTNSTGTEDRTGSIEVTPKVEVDEKYIDIESSARANPGDTINLEVPKEGTSYNNMFVYNTPVTKNKGWPNAKTPFLATDFIWSSTDTSIVEVNEQGQMIPRKAGKADVIAKLGNITYTYHIVVTNPYEETIEAESVSLDKTSLELVIGDSTSLVASILPENTTDKTLTWTSSNTKIATVENGKVTAVAKGTAEITVRTTNGKTATAKLTVKDIPPVEAESITLNKTNVTIEEGTEVGLEATITPSNATNKTVTWTSNNTSVATVNNGKVVGVSEGTAEITVTTTNGKTATATVTVTKKPDIKVESIDILKDEISLTYGEEKEVGVEFTPQNATDKTLTWKSDNEKVATVINGKIKANSSGTATITATAANGSRDSIRVFVSRKIITIKNATMNELTTEVTSVTLDGLVNNDKPVMGVDYQTRGYLVNGDNGKRNALIQIYLEDEYTNKYAFERIYTDPETGKDYNITTNFDEYTYPTNIQNVVYNYIERFEVKNAKIDIKAGDAPKFYGEPGEVYYHTYETWLLVEEGKLVGASSDLYDQEFFETYGTPLTKFEEGKTYSYNVFFKQNPEYPKYLMKEPWEDVTIIVNGKEYELQNGGASKGPDGMDYELGGEVLRITIPYTLTEEDVSLEKTSYEYTGSKITPNPVVTKNGKTLEKDKDYKVTYQNNQEVGTATVTVEGIGEYSGKISKTYSITKENITPTIDEIPSQEYTGSKITPKVNVKNNNQLLKENKDYIITYTNNINVGEATATISPVENGSYRFEKFTTNFTITPKPITEKDITLKQESVKYNGEERTVEVVIRINGKTLEKDKDYKTTYTNNKNIGTATITVEGMGNYTGKVNKTFQIVEKDVQELFFEKEEVIKTYQDEDFTNQLSHSIGDGKITYTSSDDTIATIDTNGKVTIHKAGTVDITAEASETEEYASKTTSYKLVINKKKTEKPKENASTLSGIAGDSLSTISLSKGQWVKKEEIIQKGSKEYEFTYTENNDTENYTTETFKINVYGNSKVNVKTSVNGGHGTISDGLENVLENDIITVTFTPDEGYEIDKVTINGEENKINNNKIELQVSNEDMDIVVTYKEIIYNFKVTSSQGVNVELDDEKANYHSTKEIEILPDYGYQLVSIKVNGKESIQELENNILKISNIESDYTIQIEAKPIEYNYIKGANQEYIINQMEEALFEIDADYSLFEDGGIVLIDDIEISNSLYISEEGSTIIRLSKDLLNELSLGKHSLNVIFNDGGSAKTNFTVELPEYEKIPNTGIDNSTLELLGFFLLSSLVFIKNIKRKVLN